MHLCRQATAAAAADRGSNAHSPQGRLASLPPPPDAAIAAGGVRAPPPPAPAPPPPAGAGGRGAGPSSDAAAATYQPVRTAAPTTRPPASSASRRAAGSPLSAGASHPRPPPRPAQPPSPPRPIISPPPAGLTSPPVPAPEPATPSPTPHRRSALFAAAAAPLSAPYRSATTRRALLHPTPLRSRLQHRPTPLCCSAAPLSATNILHVTTPFDSVSSLSFAAATPTGRPGAEVGGGVGGGGLGGGRRRCLA